MTGDSPEIARGTGPQDAIARKPVRKGTGTNASERYLARLAANTFLSLWSYPGVFRDQKWSEAQSEGKEVCDLLVVFDDHVLIFSDKNIRYRTDVDPIVGWRRWYKAAVKKSADQIFGAERWIRMYRDRLYLDSACTQPFPIPLPDQARMRVHRIVVAHGASEACRQAFGGSGSLMLAPAVTGDDHLAEGARPFTIGHVVPDAGFVHVLDDRTVDVLLRTLDTVTDFLEYLSRKEAFFGSGKLIGATGEEDLLAYYLRHVGPDGWHDFEVPPNSDAILLTEGLWSEFEAHERRRLQIEADRKSYAWDNLVERFGKHILNDTQFHTTERGVAHSERIVRFLAREPRTRRRALVEACTELYREPTEARRVRVIVPSRPGDPHYVLLVVYRPSTLSYSEYRLRRRQLAETYMQVAKVRFPEAQHIVAIATGYPGNQGGNDNSEDALYLDATSWTAEHQRAAEELQRETGALETIHRHHRTFKAYPDPAEDGSVRRGLRMKGNDRNKPCYCGSGLKLKRCHGRG